MQTLARSTAVLAFAAALAPVRPPSHVGGSLGERREPGRDRGEAQGER